MGAKMREGDALEVYLYLVRQEGNACDRTYDPTGKTIQMEIYRPNGSPIYATPDLVDSDDPNISAKAVRYVLSPTETGGQVGRWEALVHVDEDNLTFGVARWTCVQRRADTGVC